MRPLRCVRGFTMVDMVMVLLFMGVILATTAPLSRRLVADYQLNTATQTLMADISQAKIHAIQSNSIVPLRRNSNRQYRVPRTTRELPGMVRFKAESVDSVAYSGLGTLTQPSEGVRKFVLINSYGETREIRMYPGGGYEVR